jgi:hypothetical protein
MRETNWTTGLVGRCFHVPRSRHDGVFEVQNQGVVRAKVQEDIYLVQFFDFIMSEPTNLKLFKIEQMLAWQFYENDEHMRFWHEHRYHAPEPEAEPGEMKAPKEYKPTPSPLICSIPARAAI